MAIASLGTVPFSHATSGDSAPFPLDTRNYADSTPLFSVDTRALDVIANTGITDLGGASFSITKAMLKVTGVGAITFTLVTAPVHGKLLLGGTEQGDGATFTQAQIDAGLLSYLRSAGDPLTDTFEVAVRDDDAGLLGGNLTFAVAGIPGASGSLFLVDTRNYTESADSTVHTDRRAHLTADTVPGSLRQAIANAAAGETVDFDAGLSGGTIKLGGSQLTISKDLTIDASALPNGITISGDNASRVFEVSSPSGIVRFQKLTIRDGEVLNVVVGGGGIELKSGFLEVVDSTISENSFYGLGGGGGLYAAPGTNLIVNRSTISGNFAGGLGLGGGIAADDQSTVKVTNSSIANNVGNEDGGAILLYNASVTITNTTITGNSASRGGGIYQFGNAPSLTIQDSIVAGNTAPTGPDINKTSGTLTVLGADLIGINSTVETEFPAGPLAGTAASPLDPLLAPLGDYGGPTQTMALRVGSRAINAAGASVPLTDQRGFTRSVGGAPDIGAYEAGNAAGFAVWAIERIAYGLNMTSTGDAEDDGSPNGGEYALGTSVMISDPDSVRTPTAIENASGHVEITFGFNPDAAVDTAWVLKRSTNMVDFDEIYRYDGPTSMETLTPGVSAVLAADTFTVTDTNAFSDRVFYQFVADQDMFMSY